MNTQQTLMEMKKKCTDEAVITRRGFSKLGIAGVIGAALPGAVLAQKSMHALR
jgi:hypothetical protein